MRTCAFVRLFGCTVRNVSGGEEDRLRVVLVLVIFRLNCFIFSILRVNIFTICVASHTLGWTLSFSVKTSYSTWIANGALWSTSILNVLLHTYFMHFVLGVLPLQYFHDRTFNTRTFRGAHFIFKHRPFIVSFCQLEHMQFTHDTHLFSNSIAMNCQKQSVYIYFIIQSLPSNRYASVHLLCVSDVSYKETSF